MGEPVSTAAVFAFLNSCFKFAEYAVKLYGVESENGIFVHLIQQVQLDLEETERLLAVPAVTKKLKSTPEKWRWIRESITRTKASVNEIGKWVEPVRGEQVAYGSVSFRTKVKWIFNDHDKLVTRSAQLRAAHQTLSNVLVFLTPLEDSTSQEPESLPTYDDAISLDPLLSRQQRRQKELYLDSLQRGEKISAEGAVSSELYPLHSQLTFVFISQDFQTRRLPRNAASTSRLLWLTLHNRLLHSTSSQLLQPNILHLTDRVLIRNMQTKMSLIPFTPCRMEDLPLNTIWE